MSNSTSTNCTDINSNNTDAACYNLISSSQLTTSLWLSAAGGGLCILVFMLIRGTATWKPILHKRATQIAELISRPPPLLLTSWWHRTWSWLIPIFTLSDVDLLTTAGVDALMLVRFLMLGMQIFFLAAIIGIPILIPIYYTAGYLTSGQSNANADEFMLNTMSNLPPRSEKLWAPWVLMLCLNAWVLFCLFCHCRSYGALRALHTHGGVLLRELSTRGGEGGQEAGIMWIVGQSREDSDNEEEVDNDDIINPVRNKTKKKTKKNKKAAWRLILTTIHNSINPYAMLLSDIKLVEGCLHRLERRLERHRHLKRKQSKQLLEQQQEKEDDGVKDITITTSTTAITTTTTTTTTTGDPTGGDLCSMVNQNWGPLVTGASIPEAVCPFWLIPEHIPAPINPAVVGGGGALLGKTPSELRCRIRGVRSRTVTRFKRGSSTTDGDEVETKIQYSYPLWTTAAPFVVLFRVAADATHTNSLWNRISAVSLKLEHDDEVSDGFFVPVGSTISGTSNGSATALGEGDGEKEAENEEKSKMTKETRAIVERGEALEGALRRLYPDSFQELVPVYNHKKTDKAIEKWDGIAAQLARVERALRGNTYMTTSSLSSTSAPAKKDGADVDIEHGGGDQLQHPDTQSIKGDKKNNKKGDKTDNIEVLTEQRLVLMQALQDQEKVVLEERELALSQPLGTAYFALFTSQRDAQEAAFANIGGTSSINMVSRPAPGPDEINWEGLWAGWGEQMWRTMFLCVIPMIVIIIFPIGLLTGALTNLDLAVCGNSADTNQVYWAWFCGAPEIVKVIITGLLPVTISTMWDTWVLPFLFYIICQAQRTHASFSALDQAVIKGFYSFSLINTFIMGVLGGAFLQQVGAAIASGTTTELIGAALPAASNFFLNYVGIHALFTNLFRFVWPHDGTILFVFFRAVGMFRPKSDRDDWVIRSTPSYRGGRHYGSFLCIFIMCLSYAVIAPIILPLALCFFFTAWVAWRYAAIHFYEPCYDGKGRVYELTYQLLLITIFMANLFTAAVFLAKGGYWSGSMLAVVATVMIVMFWRYNRAHVMSMIKITPLQTAALAPKATVPRDCYLPPPLRRGAVGWFPEWGKIWEKYGLPRYSNF